LSFIDAGAIVCAPLSGYLLDSVGFIPTAFITISLGVLEMLLLLVAGDSEAIMIASFVCYAVFRAFLFPYFFASLSRKIGFRFFGMLTGIGFSLSGFSQLAIAPVATLFEGTCHEEDGLDTNSCDHGSWSLAHWAEIATLCLLLMIPIFDWLTESKKKKEKESKLLDTSTMSYGSVET
jgi:MFS family permease